MSRSRLLSVVAVGLAALGVIVADAVLVPHVSHDDAVRTAAHRRVAYGTALRTPLTTVFTVAQPLQSALDAVGGEGDGVDYVARDVLSHSTAGATLDAQVKAVQAVRAPKDLTAKAGAVVTALTKLDTAVKALPATAKLEDQPLADAYIGGAYDTLGAALTALSTATTDLYTAIGRPAPPVVAEGGGRPVTKLPASHDSWVLGVDRACAAGFDDTDSIEVPDEPQLDQAITAVGVVITAAGKVEKAVRAVPPPAGDHKVTEMVGRLTVFDRQLALLHQSLTEAKARSFGPAQSDLARAEAEQVDVNSLVKAFNDYGVTVCANFYDVNSVGDGSDSGSGSSSGGGSGGQAT